MKKLFIILLSAALLLPAAVLPARAAYNSELDLDAGIVYMLSLDKDCTVIYDKNSDKVFNPGAIVKIVTGILVIENCPSLDEELVADAESVNSVIGTGSSTVGISTGERMTVRDMLYCALVYNAADAVAVLAKRVAGSQEAFTDMMNDFAAKLGCTSTYFSNPIGYGTEQYTTAKEMAAIYTYCMNNSTFAQILGTDYFEIEPTNVYGYTRYLKTTNGLMNSVIQDYYLQHVKAGKSGVSDDDMCSCVSSASKDGYNYLCVIADAPYADFDSDDVTENMSFICAKKLYNWTFSNIKLKIIANTSAYVTEVRVRLSDEYDYVSLSPAEEISALVPSLIGSESVLIEPIPDTIPESVKAPLKKGDIIGRAAIKYAGETIAEVDLCAAFDVKVNYLRAFVDGIFRILKSTAFRVLFCISLAAGLAFVFYVLRGGKPRKKNKLTVVKK